MARKSNGKVTRSASGDWRDKIHWVDLSYNDENDLKEWVAVNNPEWPLCLEELVDGGWSIKVSPDKDGPGVFTTITSRDDKSDFFGHSFIFKYPLSTGGIVVLYWYATVWLEDKGGQLHDSMPEDDWLALGK